MNGRIVWLAAFAAVALFAPRALAQPATREVTLFSGMVMDHEGVQAHFHVNRDLGRAWVAVELTPDAPGGYPFSGETQNVPRAVAGLSYDKAAKQVVYQSGPVRAVCAEDSTFLWDEALKETGQCPLRVSVSTKTVDNGFNPHPENFATVVLQLPAAKASPVSTR